MKYLHEHMKLNLHFGCLLDVLRLTVNKQQQQNSIQNIVHLTLPSFFSSLPSTLTFGMWRLNFLFQIKFIDLYLTLNFKWAFCLHSIKIIKVMPNEHFPIFMNHMFDILCILVFTHINFILNAKTKKKCFFLLIIYSTF